MAKNRYGRIYHSNHNHINLRFPSADARDEFAVKFQKYHNSHEHDGEAPRFENVTAAEAGGTTSESQSLQDAHSVTIDGYASYEIEEYHEDEKQTYYYRYKPPTCCVAPLISIDRKLVDSGSLERHALSAIFKDMDEEYYQPLLESVAQEGFIDNVIRLYEGQILDGWHRYRAAKELNLLRKLRFKQWHEDDHRDGDPKAFVLGRNIHRRHYTPGQRAQIVVHFNDRFEKGDIESQKDGSPSGEPKTREQLAKEAGGVGLGTIDRAIAVEKQGESEAVRTGEKSASEVLKAREAEQRLKKKKKKLKAMWDARIQSSRDYLGEGDTALNQYLTQDEVEAGFARYHETLEDAFKAGMQRYELARGDFARFQELADVSLEALEKECKAVSLYAHDIANYQEADWIQQMIQWKKDALASASKPEPRSPEPEPEPGSPEPEPDLKTLREQVKARISKYKEWYKESGYKEYELISHASFSHFIEAYRDYEDSEVEGAATVDELRGLLDTLKRKSYPFAYRLRRLRGGASESLVKAQERAQTRRKRMWSYFQSEIRVKQGKSEPELSAETFAKAAATVLGLDTIRAVKDDGLEYCFGADEFIRGDIESPPYSLSDCSLADAAMWASRFDIIAIALMEMADWVKALTEAEETLPENTMTDTVNWDRIRSAMGIVTSELEKVEYSDEEQAQIEEMKTEIMQILDKYTAISRDVKLWILAKMAYKYMEELDEKETQLGQRRESEQQS